MSEIDFLTVAGQCLVFTDICSEIIVGRNTSDDANDGCKTNGNHKKNNRMITEFGQ